ncbi:hypothetical protein ACLB2K_004925 [Fragaria x ananassa]
MRKEEANRPSPLHFVNIHGGLGDMHEVVASGLGQYEEPQKDPPQKVEFDGAATHGTRVPAKSVCRIRCVSKMLLSIVDSPSFVKLHSTSLLDQSSSRRSSKLPPSHRIAQQICGPYSEARDVSTGMGFDSITNTYKILRVTNIRKRYGGRCWVVQVLVLGRSEWRQVTSAPPPDITLRCYKNVCAHGDMHWLLYPFKFSEAVCCEWEHGILFTHSSATITLFLDMRGPVVTKTLVKCPIEGYLVQRHIISLHGSLISLKSFANLEEAEEPATYSDGFKE